MKRDAYFDEEPCWDWEAQRLVSVRDLTVWSARVPSVRMSHRILDENQPNPQWADGRLIGLAMHPTFLFAASEEDGRMLWRHPIYRHRVEPYVALDGANGYVAARNQLRAIRLEDGKLLWKYRPPITDDLRIDTRPMVDQDGVYVLDVEGALQKVCKANGKPLWRTPISAGKVWLTESPKRVEELVIVRAAGGCLAACDVQTGEIAWKTVVKSLAGESLQVLDGHLVLNSENGLAIVDAKTGSVEATWAPDNEELMNFVATDRGIAAVLRSPERRPTPGLPPMQYQPERLVFLDRSLQMKWSLQCPPFSQPRLQYDSELEMILEEVGGQLGFVDVKTGVREWFVYGFARLIGDSTCVPQRRGEHLYWMSKLGTLTKLRLPFSPTADAAR